MRNSRFILFLFLVILLFSFSCTKEGVNDPVGNQAPDTGISLYPDGNISPQPSRLKINWWGDDPDGLIAGFYFSWDNTIWNFTPSNDSTFSLKIGASDTTFTFMVSAADAQGNGVHDQQVIQNGIDFGPEPFIDENENGNYDEGEFFWDIGLIDPTPAVFDFPLKNSAPTIQWNELSFVPEISFPVMSFSWIAEDIDGEETIVSFNIALNDTTIPEQIISLDGSVRTITIRTDEFSSTNPMMEILIEGLETNIHPEPLPGLLFDEFNVFFVQAEDISGAKSQYIALPDTGSAGQWFVRKPVGSLLIVDDYKTLDNTSEFYSAMFDSLGLSHSYDIYDIHTNEPPFKSVTFFETIKLFDFLFWYTDNNPSIDLASFSTQKYLDQGGKVAFSMQFPQTVDPVELQSFMPIISDSIDAIVSLLPGTIVASDTTNPSYPNLETTLNVFRIKSFYLNPLAANAIYYFPNGELKGFTGFTNSQKTEFFIALPLDRCNGGQGNVKPLLERVFFEDFGLVP